tara:strand:+ start:88 stop:1353 length:1266 start_codon:yes stop_codon:yes gene_type:complete
MNKKNSYMTKLGKKAKIASKKLESVDLKLKNSVLEKFLGYLKNNKKKILEANDKDFFYAKSKKNNSAVLNRLKIDNYQIEQMRESIYEIIKFKDPIGNILFSTKRPNGLIIKKISIPIGVIGVIYESRPNVTSDVAALCFKSSNAVILKGGSEAFNTNKILSDLFRAAIKNKNFDENCVQFIKNRNRSAVDYLLSNMKEYVDIIIPRGGKNLVQKVQTKSVIPTIGHLEGICHVYINSESNLNMAIKVLNNSKMRNTSICGAAETLLIDSKCLKTHSKSLLDSLNKMGCKIIGEKILQKYYKGKFLIAKEKDWKTEYLHSTISVKIVDDVNDAINHINKYGTSHTDTIITENKKIAQRFVMGIKSSIAVHNASTQFADGGELGFGAEIGISTNKMHPRGPVGLEQLTTYKYILKGNGQIRN